MIVSTRNKQYTRKFQYGRGNIWTTIGNIFSKLLGSTMKEAIKSVAKKTAEDIGQQAGNKGVQFAKDKFSKLLASKANKKSKVKTQLNEILTPNHFKGYGPSLGSTLTEGLGVKKI